jgi:hypothetical protein
MEVSSDQISTRLGKQGFHRLPKTPKFHVPSEEPPLAQASRNAQVHATGFLQDDGCTSAFPRLSRHAKHLGQKHKLDEDEIEEMLGEWRYEAEADE